MFFWQLWWAAASIGRMCQNIKIAIFLQFTPQLSGQTNPATSSISSNTILVDTGRRNLKASKAVSLNTVHCAEHQSAVSFQIGPRYRSCSDLDHLLGVIIMIIIIMRSNAIQNFQRPRPLTASPPSMASLTQAPVTLPSTTLQT